MKCKNCETNDAVKYSKYSIGEFCSRECARAYSTKEKRKETNDKISKKLKGRSLSDEHKNKLKGNKNTFGKKGAIITIEDRIIVSERIKKYWKEHPEKIKSISEKLSGRKLSEETKQKLRDIANEKIKNGTHTGWKKRGKPSYAEMFFMNVLENNKIKYRFEKPVGKYFVDFAIESKKIALEIDEKQHKQRKDKDEEKDKYLKENNWKVYRIEWKSINSIIGKEYIKNEINKFLQFYYSIGDVV